MEIPEWISASKEKNKCINWCVQQRNKQLIQNIFSFC